MSTNPCATCGACCRSYVVPVCGRDIWMISTRQRLNPEEFVTAYPLPRPTVETFRLNREGFNFGLALDKQGKFEPNRPCVFLTQLGGGHARCGVYAHRPVVCQSYPMVLYRQRVVQRKDSLCPPDSWSEVEKLRPEWRAKLQRVDMAFDVYHEIVARWNARLEIAPSGTTFPLSAYLNYLMNVYDRLAALDVQVGEAALARIEANWSSLPEDGNIAGENIDHDAFPWISYLGAAREIIDSFYPEIGPRPSPALARASSRRGADPPRRMIPDDLLAASS